MNVMESEILQQPEVCARLFERESKALAGFVATLKKRRPAGILLAARGSSDHAAVYARYLLEFLTGIPVALAAPSLLTVFGKRSLVKPYLVVGISQSGQGPDICAVLKDATRQGALTLALTNDPSSPLSKASSHCLDLGAGKELAVAATKTYSAELAGLALLGALWSGKSGLLKELNETPAAMVKVLKASQAGARSVAERCEKLESCVVLGRGFQLGNTHEVALKMKECAGVPALSYSTADFQHGPVALVKKGFPVFMVSAPGKAKDEAATLANLASRGADIHAIGIGPVNRGMSVKAKAPEWLSPLLTILPGQWFAFYLGLAKGKDPSKPIGLKKVTKTV